MTVKEAIQQHLDRLRMSGACSEAFLEFFIPLMQRIYQDNYQEIIARANSGLVDAEAVEKLKNLAQDAKMAAECWNKDGEQYSTEQWEILTRTVEDVALGWAIARLNTLEETLQEMQRLISAALNGQGKAD